MRAVAEGWLRAPALVCGAFEHDLDRRGAADGRAGGCQDLTLGLTGAVEASYGGAVVVDAERKGGDGGQAEPGGDEALGGPVIIRFGYPARDEFSLPEGGAGGDSAAADSAAVSIHGSAAASLA